MIFICGMIGVGKTTYASMLATELATQVHYESVDDNPVLAKYYAEPEKYSFMSQIYYLGTRLEAMKNAKNNVRDILDRSIFEDVLFAEVNHALSKMSDEEKTVYDSISGTIVDVAKGLSDKNLYIYLKADFETILSRIRLRDRGFEQNPELVEYYRALHTRYDNWMRDNIPQNQLLIIETKNLDIYREEDKNKVLSEIYLRMRALGV